MSHLHVSFEPKLTVVRKLSYLRPMHHPNLDYAPLPTKTPLETNCYKSLRLRHRNLYNLRSFISEPARPERILPAERSRLHEPALLHPRGGGGCQGPEPNQGSHHKAAHRSIRQETGSANKSNHPNPSDYIRELFKRILLWAYSCPLLQLT